MHNQLCKMFYSS